MFLCACPVPDDYVAVNNPPYIVEAELEPPNTGVVLLDCSQFPDDTKTFTVYTAIEDPDVDDDKDTMFYAWYVSTSDTDEQGQPVQRLVLREEHSYELTCQDGNFATDAPNILTVYVLDRRPISTIDEAVKFAGPDGFAVSVSWVVQVIAQ